MARIISQRKLTIWISAIPLFLSIPIFGMSIYMLINSCAKMKPLPVLFFLYGLAMFVIGFFSWCGVMCKDSKCAGLPCLVMPFALLFMIGFITFLSLVSKYSGSPEREPDRPGYVQYRFDHFSSWLRHKVSGMYTWDRVITFIAPSGSCDDLNHTYSLSQQLFAAHLTHIQSGCCVPPSKCGFTFVSPTNWTAAATSNQTTAAVEGDCAKWSNDQSKLCFNCDSCRAGLLADMRKKLIIANIIVVVTLVVSVLVSGFMCFKCESFMDDEWDS
ncbi:unnamed protein product [Cuscuta europaea]|uniref:Uncharacterized protein n=1 Tax=Cuscuta europaea TaxID=41803 RepID=A0A9P0ZJE6_CUSEU|nr:unnamed protein product [Cuscuta europaea]